MFSYREKQASYWRNTDTKVDPVRGTLREPVNSSHTETIPFTSLSKKPFQRTIVGSEKLEQIRQEIRGNTAVPLANNEGWREQNEREAEEHERQWRENEEQERLRTPVAEGRQAALEYTMNKTMEKEVAQEKQTKRALVDEYTKPKPMKLRGVETSSQLYFGPTTVNLKHYWEEKRREADKRRAYEETVYHPDQKTKAQTSTQTVGANKIW